MKHIASHLLILKNSQSTLYYLIKIISILEIKPLFYTIISPKSVVYYFSNQDACLLIYILKFFIKKKNTNFASCKGYVNTVKKQFLLSNKYKVDNQDDVIPETDLSIAVNKIIESKKNKTNKQKKVL